MTGCEGGGPAVTGVTSCRDGLTGPVGLLPLHRINNLVDPFTGPTHHACKPKIRSVHIKGGCFLVLFLKHFSII